MMGQCFSNRTHERSTVNNHSEHDLKPTARMLRHNMTKEEKHLWYDFLKKLPYTVYRQKQLGCYIVDFLISIAGIVIEVDGSQHYTEEGLAKDAERDLCLSEMGLTVLRYSNSEVNGNFEGVCLDIMRCMNEKGFSIGWSNLK